MNIHTWSSSPDRWCSRCGVQMAPCTLCTSQDWARGQHTPCQLHSRPPVRRSWYLWHHRGPSNAQTLHRQIQRWWCSGSPTPHCSLVKIGSHASTKIIGKDSYVTIPHLLALRCNVSRVAIRISASQISQSLAHHGNNINIKNKWNQHFIYIQHKCIETSAFHYGKSIFFKVSHIYKIYNQNVNSRKDQSYCVKACHKSYCVILVSTVIKANINCINLLSLWPGQWFARWHFHCKHHKAVSMSMHSTYFDCQCYEHVNILNEWLTDHWCFDSWLFDIYKVRHKYDPKSFSWKCDISWHLL